MVGKGVNWSDYVDLVIWVHVQGNKYCVGNACLMTVCRITSVRLDPTTKAYIYNNN